jgi:hypothetical protein
MNKVIKNILEMYNAEEINNELDLLQADINFARKVASGEWSYCPECDDYYISDCFLRANETKPTKVCIYNDPINSGGDDYADGYLDIEYSICPKNHRIEISRNERQK